jgi:hypothetical protein
MDTVLAVKGTRNGFYSGRKGTTEAGIFIRESESLARVEEERYKQTTPATVDITTSLRQATGRTRGFVKPNRALQEILCRLVL